jgi:transcriptional regulator with XRE-family HTH domain
VSRVSLSGALARTLRRARDARGLFRKQLAAEAGVTFAFVKIAEERLTGTVNETHLRAVMAVLGITEIPEDEPAPEIFVRWRTDAQRVELPEDFRVVLVNARKALGLSQREIAFRSKTPPSTVCNVEQGADARNPQNTLGGEVLCRWLTALEVSEGSPLGLKARALGLRWVKRRRKNIDWDAQPLGEIPDTEIARDLDVKVAQVWRARKRRGIPAVDRSKWRTQVIGVNTRSPNEVASILGDEVPRHPNGRVDWDRVPLGKVPDRAIARWSGACTHTVGAQRRKRNILRGHQGRINWSEEPLGEIPDTAIAAKVGVSVTSVAHARKARGIPPAPREARRSHVFVERTG